MTISTHLMLAWAKQLENKIVSRTISQLRNITDTLSGDDSGLVNTWDEICVQAQGVESFYGSMYDQTCEAIIENFVEELSFNERQVLWINTPSGYAWWDKHADDCDWEKSFCIDNDDIVQMIFESLSEKAASYSNKRIRKYLDYYESLGGY